jgi:hypothetical protein
VSPKPKSLADRFWSRVDKNGPVPPHRPELGPCWAWTSTLSHFYGAIGVGSETDGSNRTIGAHVVAFFLAHGRWADPCALHACDNPPCVKAWDDALGRAHIFEGTRADNSRDMAAKGRQIMQRFPELVRGERNGRAILTGDQVRQIVERHRAGETLTAIAATNLVSIETIYDITHGRSWTHVTGLVRSDGRR